MTPSLLQPAPLLGSSDALGIFVDKMRKPAWLIGEDASAVHLSPSFLEYTGRVDLDSSGLAWLEVLEEALRDTTVLSLREGLVAGAPFATTTRVRDHAGEHHTFSLDLVPLRAPGLWLATLTPAEPVISVLHDPPLRTPDLSEASLHALLLDQAFGPAFAWELGRERVIRFWNEAAEGLYGIRRHDALGHDPRELLRSKPPASWSNVDASLAADGSWTGELLQHTSDGRTLFVETVMKVVRFPDGSRIALQTGRDVTARREEERARVEAQTRLQLALSASRTGIWEYLIACDHLFWSAETFAMLRVDPRRFTGSKQDFARLVHPEDAPALWSAFEQALARGGEFEQQYRMQCDDGRVLWVHNHCVIERDAEGAARRVIGTLRDLTELHALHTQLGVNDARYRALADAMPQIVWTTHPDGGFDWINERWREYTGAETDGDDIRWSFVHPDDVESIAERWRVALASTSVGEFEYRLRRQDGVYRWHLGRVVPFLEDGELVRWVATATDIDDRKRAEEALRAADRRKDEFLAVLSHELRNPLAPITSAVELMKLRDGVATEHEIAVIERQARHMVRLVDDLLDVSRVARGKVELRREPIEIARVVARAVEVTAVLFEQRQHTLSVAVPDGGLQVDGDEVRLTQVVINLLTNAARYTKSGGHVQVVAAREGEHVVVRVRDDGSGIAPDLLPHVFEMFVQGPRGPDRAEGGLGLGLALVQSLTALHGGSVHASSAGLGLGSTFELRLPWLAPTASNAEPARALERQTTQRRTILVVDDNEDAADMLSLILERAGFEVRVAHDPPTALSLVQSWCPEIAILDIGLPVMDGHQLARALRTQLGERVPTLIALSGYGQPQDHANSSDSGFTHHLTKPVTRATLLSVLAGELA